MPALATEIVIRFAGESSDFDPIPIGEIVILDNEIGLEVPPDACGVRLRKPGQLWDEPWGFHEVAAGNIGSYMDDLFGNGASADYLQVNGPIGACDSGLYTFQTPATADSPTFFPPGSGSIVMQVFSAAHVEWVLDSGEFEPAEIPENEEPMSMMEICENVPEFCESEEPDFTICPYVAHSDLDCESESDSTGLLINHFTSAGARARVAGGLVGAARQSFSARQYTAAVDMLRRARTELDRADARVSAAMTHETRLFAAVPTQRATPLTTVRFGGLQASRAGVEQAISSCRRQIDTMLRSIRTQTATKFNQAQRDCAIAMEKSDEVVDHLQVLRAANLPRMLPR